MLDVLLDALLDALKMLPFLLVTFFALEYLEHRASERVLHAFVKASRLGPLAGTAFGLIPQCGFSVMASSFFAAHGPTKTTLQPGCCSFIIRAV